MKKTLSSIALFAMTFSSIAPLAFVPTLVLADVGTTSGTITATYDADAQELHVSGGFSGAPTASQKRPGFAVFINGNTPDTSALETRVNLISPEAASGSFSKTYSSIATAPTSVCVVIYDVNDPSGVGGSGGHSDLAAGANHNDDNSWDKNTPKETFPAGSCDNSIAAPTPGTKTITIDEISDDSDNPPYTSPFSFSCEVNPLLSPITVSGSGTGSTPPGLISQYDVQLDWGDGNTDDTVGTIVPDGDPEHGSFTFTYTGTHDYTTNGSYTIKALLYHNTIPGNDGDADAIVSVQTCIITEPVNTNPTLSNVPSTVTIPELAAYTFTATATDSDLPAQTLTFSLVGAPAGASINPSTGVFTWTPTEAQGPGVYPFSVVVSDGNGGTDTESITITVTEVNSLPVATGASVSTHMNTPLLITLAGSDSDLPANLLTYFIVTNPLNGILGAVSGNQVTYTPNTDYVGGDSFVFEVFDGTASSTSANINITVGNDAPTLSTIANQTVDELTLLTVTPSATDPNSDTLTYSITNAPVGSSFDTSTGVLTWTPTEAQGPAVYSGIIITVTDGSGSDSKTFSITVNEVNVAPVANNLSVTTNEDTATSTSVTATDVDLPANTLTFGVVTGPTNGTLTVFNTTTGAFTYSPSANYNGSDSFTFEANDGTASSSPATVSITVNPVEDPSYQCSDDIDNDDDDLTDSQDPQCHTDGNASNSESYNPQDNDESAPVNNTDVCVNIEGNQNTVPNGMMQSGANCVELPGDNVTPPGGGGSNGPVNFGAVFGGGSVLGASTTGQVLGDSCGLYLEKHIRLGSSKNNPDQVKKLQSFLNKWMHSNLPITGFYGPLTFAQVQAFQSKYSDDVLKPWGLNAPTGLVYLATITKINKLECPELTLTLPPLVPWSQNPNAQ